MSRYSFKSMIRGDDVYHDVWDTARGERLSCQWERSNLHDIFENGAIVEHPRKISAVRAPFLQHF